MFRNNLLLAVFVIVGSVNGWFLYQEIQSEVEDPFPEPEREMDVTCWKWIENGTAQVSCPEKVYAPDSVVNISVKDCANWTPRYGGEFAGEKPC